MSGVAPAAPVLATSRDQRPEWMTEQEVSDHVRIPVETLRDWRRTGAVRVLPFHRIGRLVRYERSEVDQTILAGRVEVAS